MLREIPTGQAQVPEVVAGQRVSRCSSRATCRKDLQKWLAAGGFIIESFADEHQDLRREGFEGWRRHDESSRASRAFAKLLKEQ